MSTLMSDRATEQIKVFPVADLQGEIAKHLRKCVRFGDSSCWRCTEACLTTLIWRNSGVGPAALGRLVPKTPVVTWGTWSNSYVCHNSMSCKSCTFHLSSEQQKYLCCWRPWQQNPHPSKPLDYTSECGAAPAQEGNMLGALPLVFAENSDFFKKKSESVKPQKPHSTTF